MHIETPQYDPVARQTGLQGDVVIEVNVDRAGQVTEERLLSGHPLLAREAERNARAWTFAPGAPRSLRILYEFRLEGPVVDEQPIPRVIFDLPGKVRIISRGKKIDP